MNNERSKKRTGDEFGKTSSQLNSMFALYARVSTEADLTLNDKNEYMEVDNIRITPKKLVFTNPFEGKEYAEVITIRNHGNRPVLIRLSTPNSMGVHIQTIKKAILLCSGMALKRKVTCKVQMMTMIKAYSIPIYINDNKPIEYPVRIVTTPLVLEIVPDALVDFGMIDVSCTPAKKTIKIVNKDVKPANYFIDLGPNDLGLSVEPSRGIILGEQAIEIVITATFLEEGIFTTEFWIVAEVLTCIQVKANVGVADFLPKFVPRTPSFTFIQFPPTYYGISAVKNVIIHSTSMTQSFFCVLGEVEMTVRTLKQLQKEIEDYKFFSITPEEGRLFPNDVRVFKLIYTPRAKKTFPKPSYHLVMMQLKRLKVKDLNVEDYPDDVFEESTDSGTISGSDSRKSSDSTFSEECTSRSELEVVASHINEADISVDELRLMLYGQVEEVQVSVLPDTLSFPDIEEETITRVLQLQNNCAMLPIFFRYKKIAFVEVEPRFGELKPLESLDVSVYVTPKSFEIVNTHIPFDLLYYDGKDGELVIVEELKIPLFMHQAICSTKQATSAVLAKDFDFRKPNQRPNDMILAKLLHSDVYIGFPDDRPRHNSPDRLRRHFKSIYAAMPRYHPRFNEYALTARDRKLKKMKDYYNIYINMMAMKKKLETGEELPNCSMPSCRPSSFKPKRLTSETIRPKEFIPLTPIQLVCIDIEPRNKFVENVAFNSTYLHTLTLTNRTQTFLKINLKGKKEEYIFLNGTRYTILPNEEKTLSFMIIVEALPVHSYELDVIINNTFVVSTNVMVKARPKHLTLSMDLLTFYESDPPSKFVELRNELNVDIQFQWKVPAVFKVDPDKGEVVSGRFVACMITFQIGLAENMVYDLGIHTDNKYYNLKVLIEGTNYKIKFPKSIAFDTIPLNVPCNRTIPLCNVSTQRLTFEVNDEDFPDGFTVTPSEGYIDPMGTVNLVACANLGTLGVFNTKIDVTLIHYKKITCEATGNVIFPDLQFTPDILRFRKMAASSFDIVCVTVVNTSDVLATIQFDTERFPEFSYSEFTNTSYMTDKDILYVNPRDEKKFTIHFYPYNPLVTSFPLPLVINKVGFTNKSKMSLMAKPSIKVHTQVLSYKLEVKSWRYNFSYFPYFDNKNVTSHSITIKNPGKNLLTFCIRLDELAPPFQLAYVAGVKTINYQCSFVVDLQPEEWVTFEATFLPVEPGEYSIRLPLFVRDDFTRDMHNYFYFMGSYPEASYSCADDAVHLGFIPLNFTIYKKFAIEMSYHNPDCNCRAILNDLHCYVEIDNSRMKSISSYKLVSIIFNSSRPHVLNCKLELSCDCPGGDFEMDVFGGSENNYFTVHACIEYFKLTSTVSLETIFNASVELGKASTITMQDHEKEESVKHNYITDLPFFPSGKYLMEKYMNQIVAVFEKWITEQVFFSAKAYSIPDTICQPEIKVYEKQGKREGLIKLPLQHIMSFLMGSQLMASFEIKYNERKPVWMLIRKFYRDFLGQLVNVGCFINMIAPEILLPYEMYQEYMRYSDKQDEMLKEKPFYLMAKQSWLDLIMQTYKVLVAKRLAQLLLLPSPSSKSIKAKNSAELMMSKQCGITIASVTIFSPESVMLLLWVDKQFQDRKARFASQISGNNYEAFMQRKIENFESDLSDSLGIISCILTSCSFLEEHIVGVYAPANNRMERCNNAYILLKLLSLLQVSFHLEMGDIIEPITIHMIMFLTYLYEFLLPLKSTTTIVFQSELSQTKDELISIVNDNNHRIFYNIIFFKNTDDLFSVENNKIYIDAGNTFKLSITYYARFLRVQKTAIFLCGEIPGGQYTNSKVYYLEGYPDLSKSGMPPIELKSMVYKIKEISLDIVSPYKEECTYDIFLVNDETQELDTILDSLIPYASILDTRILVRCKFSTPFAEADEHGKITMKAVVCSIINSSKIISLLFRDQTVGDFIVKLKLSSKPMKKVHLLELDVQKSMLQSPCTCHRKKPNVMNTKCSRNVKVMIPCRNQYLWSAVMKVFLAGRDPEEAEFWDIYADTPVGSHIVERILYDHKKMLTDDMLYFMNKSFTYNVKSKKPNAVVTQKLKVITETSAQDMTTDIMVHINDMVKSFILILESDDAKEKRTYKVCLNYK